MTAQTKPHDLFETAQLSADLKSRSVRGGAVTVGTHVTRFGLHTAALVVLARLLAPADFGLVAMVVALTNVAVMFKDIGLTDATVQREHITHHQVSTLFWINAAFGLLTAGIIAALGPVVAWFYAEPRLTLITAAIATVFLFGGLASQHRALLRRRMSFGRLGMIEIGATALAAAAAVAAALLGAGYWALVVKHVAVAVCTTIGCWVAMPWLPGRPRRDADIGAMLAFGVNVSGFNLVNYFSRNADNVLIGRVLGATALGFYSKAYSLLMLPISQIRMPLTSVGMPALSRLRNEPQRYRNYYRKLLQTLAFVTAPVAVLLGVYAYELVLIVLGPQWIPVAGVFRILSVTALLQSVGGTTGIVMLSLGKARRHFRLGIIGAFIAVMSFVVGLPWGIRGVAFSYTVANVIMLLPLMSWSFKGTPVKTVPALRSVLLPAGAAVAAAGLSRVLFWLLRPALGMTGATVVGLAAAAVLYLGCHLVLPAGRVILKEIRLNLQLLRG